MTATIGLRAHQPDPQTLKAYDRLAAEFGSGVHVLVDEVTAGPHRWPEHVRTVPITPERLGELGLRADLSDSGWRCGDYALASLFHHTQAETAWLMEPDVGFSRIRPSAFTRLFDHLDTDFLVHSMAPAGPGGFWTGTLTSRGFTGQEWHSFFPLLRASRAASDAAVALRRATQDVPTTVMHPNDETVLATAVVDAGLSWGVLPDHAPGMFRRFSPGKRVPQWALAAVYRGPQVFHPVGPADVLRTRRPWVDLTSGE